MEKLTVQTVLETMCHDLEMTWRSGRDSSNRVLSREDLPEDRPELIGPLTFGKSHRIQLLGASELALLITIDSSTAPHTDMFCDCELLVVTSNLEPPESLLQLADEHKIPLLVSRCTYRECLNKLRYRLTEHFADRAVVHGVLMDVLGTGVMITGESGIGKSELALELVSRGHILVADDAPEFRRIAPETLEGSCPPLLQDFLEVRGLGILNVARMYGDAHTRRRKILKFIIELRAMRSDELNDSIDRVSQNQFVRELLGVNIHQTTLPVAPGRNLAVLVEAAVRNHILVSTGYSATDDLVSKHNTQLEID